MLVSKLSPVRLLLGEGLSSSFSRWRSVQMDFKIRMFRNWPSSLSCRNRPNHLWQCWLRPLHNGSGRDYAPRSLEPNRLHPRQL